jgi:hypothetical protein
LIKKGRHSKFAPKAVEGFLLGYDSNTKAYRVFNKSSGLVEVSSDCWGSSSPPKVLKAKTPSTR